MRKRTNHCPFLNKTCIEDECTMWVTIRGYDTNTGKDVDSKQCVLTTLPMLLIENSSQQRGTGAAVESLRNEMVNKASVTNELLTHMIIPAQVASLKPSQVNVYELPESSSPES
jgi:hypothetical protein